MVRTRKIRYLIFLRDVLVVSLMAFGGPQAHMVLFLDTMVRRRAYLTEAELMELYALCQVLPGPTSTQTITAIGFRVGGPTLAYLTLLVWCLPAVTIMIIAGVVMSLFAENQVPTGFTRFIQPIAVGFVAFAAYRISSKVVATNLGYFLMIVTAIVAYFFPNPYVFPALLILGGAATMLNYRRHARERKTRFKVVWTNFFLWAGVFVGIAALGLITQALPIRLFENFYRNGSLIFGGGQVLVPLLYTEFVEFKHYLTSEEFLSGFAFAQSVPGPTFSFSAYVGTLSMREYGTWGEVLGGFIAAAGIFLPGTFLIFFVIRFWDALKKYRIVRASLEGVHAASSGLVVAAALLLFEPIPASGLNLLLIVATFGALTYTKLPAPVIILLGLASGFIF